jgi:hypothetical protein
LNMSQAVTGTNQLMLMNAIHPHK